MAQSTWSYLQNPFDNVTKKSNKHMFLMATDHFDKLSSRKDDPKINELYIFGKPFFDNFCEKYRKVSTDSANYQMQTERTVKLLEELSSTLARRWDIQIQVVYDVVTSEYKSLLPHGRAQFQSGAYDLRINEVQSLANRLSFYPEFATLQAEIEAFYKKIVEARSKQQGNESVVQMNSQNAEIARFALAQAMHSIFGALLNLYFTDTAKVETFYELKYLRKTISDKGNEPIVSEEVEIPQNKTIPVLEGKITEGVDIRLVNTGDTTLSAYSAPNAQSKPPLDGGYIVYSGQIVTFSSKSNDSVLLITNEHDKIAGKMFVELLN